MLSLRIGTEILFRILALRATPMLVNRSIFFLFNIFPLPLENPANLDQRNNIGAQALCKGSSSLQYITLSCVSLGNLLPGCFMHVLNPCPRAEQFFLPVCWVWLWLVVACRSPIRKVVHRTTVVHALCILITILILKYLPAIPRIPLVYGSK